MVEPPAHAFVVVVPGELRGKGRPRFPKGGGRPYTPAATEQQERTLGQEARAVFRGPPLVGALALHITLRLLAPQSWSKRKRAAALAGEIRPTGKPDLDNVAKIVGDAWNKIVWVDDSQIAEVAIARHYAEEASATIAVWQIP